MNTNLIQINTIAYIISAFVVDIFITLKSIHIMQLNSYNIDQQRIWYRKNYKNYYTNLFLLIFIIVNSIIIKPEYGVSIKQVLFTNQSFTAITNLIYILNLLFLIPITLLVILIENLPRKAKKPLVFTNRIKRLFLVNIIVFILLNLLSIINEKLELYFPFFIVAIAPIINFIIFLVMDPIEKSIRNKFKNEAKTDLLLHKNLHKVAITGSYGKTSVKHFLKEILSESFNVTMTPASYNTAMGVALTIKNDLKNTDDVFIAEFGARRIGDIRELADFVEPDSCIITEVGNQHLDTFKNVESVLNTKFEVVDHILNKKYVDGSFILVNGDNELIKNKISSYKKNKKLNKHKIYTFGLNEDNDFVATQIKTINEYNDFKTSFILKINNEDIRKNYLNISKHIDSYIEKDNIEFKTSLIGRLNIIDLLASISASILLKENINEIVYKVNSISQVAHRLELKRINNETAIIDDAYNSNPIGAKNAVSVLNDFESVNKIIITPGMVELGKKQYEENKNFGIVISEVCDYAYIVGKTNRNALLDGVNENIYRLKEVKTFNDFLSAYYYALDNVKGNKIILIENDLPDNY